MSFSSSSSSLGSSSYHIIAGLNRDLLNSSGVTKKRTALTKLVEHLQDSRFRQKLAQEAGGGRLQSDAIRKQQALSTLWNSIIGNALMAVHQIFSGKAKATPQDVQCIKTLLHQYIRQQQQPPGPSQQQQQQQSQQPQQPLDSKRRDDSNATNAIRPHLSTENIGKLREFCLTSLADDAAVHVAEVQLLQLLQSICARDEFVRCFRVSELGEILSELEVRLEVTTADDNKDGGNHHRATGTSPQVLDAAAKCFESLIKTACLDVGIGMHTYLASCVELVSNRCKDFIHDTPSLSSSSTSSASQAKTSGMMHAVLPTLVNTATILMKAHPDQAIASLRRDGGAMLSYAKRRYPWSDQNTKDTLIDYFQTHL